MNENMNEKQNTTFGDNKVKGSNYCSTCAQKGKKSINIIKCWNEYRLEDPQFSTVNI